MGVKLGALTRAVALVGVIALGGTAGASAASGGRVKGAVVGNARSEVGAIMSSSNDASDPDAHICSAAVVHSTTHDLVITAAHCLAGDGSGLTFVPRYAEGERPLGTWTVTRAYATTGWLQASADHEKDDYVILRVAPQKIDGVQKNVEDVTGGLRLDAADAMAMADPHTERRFDVDVLAYNNDEDAPIGCRARVVTTGTFPAFHCDGFVSGSSGSPWILEKTVRGRRIDSLVGVLGGLHQGGCTSLASFSSPLDHETTALLARAEAGGPGDTLPEPADDGC